jgi:1,2-diacylglycerol 3-alpha-glucosyltransferase
MNSMKIGFFTDSYLPQLDGLATSVEVSARALEERGHEVYIIAPRYPRYKDITPNVYRLTSIKFVDAPEMRWALQLPEKPLLKILRLNFDIIHGHSGGGMTLLGLEIARAKNIPFVGTYHTMLNRYTHYFFNGKIVTPKMLEVATKLIGNLCDNLIAPTERVKEELVTYGVKKPIHVLPSGIDLENYKNVEKGFIRNTLKIKKDTKILLYVGRLGKEKSVDFLIRSFQLVHEKSPDTVLVLVGEGSEKQSLKRLVNSLQLKENVIFFGSVKHHDIPKVYADADIFVFASRTETQGLVLLEALASGLPVVTVDDDAFDNVIKIAKNGYLVKSDTKLFAEKTLDLLTNEALYKSFSESALKIVEKFSVENTAMYLEKLYEQVIIEKGKRNKASISIKSINSFREFLLKTNEKLRKYYE